MISVKFPLVFAAMLASCLPACHKSTIGPQGISLSLTPQEQQQVNAGNVFTLKLFNHIDSAGGTSGNIFISPLSVSFAMGMTSNGSSGATLTAIRNTMGYNAFTQSQVNNFYSKLVTDLPKLDPATTLNIANAIWYRQDFSVLPQFVSTNSTFYAAKVQALDFNSAASLTTINDWVSMQTKGAIPSIISSLSPDDEMCLVNAIYFKSVWKERFDPAKTSKQPFYPADNSTVQADFMDGKVDYKRYGDNEAIVVEMPYSNDKFSMVIVTPAGGQTVQQLAAAMDSAKWAKWITGLTPVQTEVKLPKFKFGYNIDLSAALTASGMGIAFSGGADFSLISNTLPLKISKVLQKAVVEVDESGTTAAAATAVIIATYSVANPPVLVIDHPFLFAIRETGSGLILFTGAVNNPLQYTP